MNYSKYDNEGIKRILNLPNYEKITRMLEDLVQTSEDKEKLKEILSNGGTNGFGFVTNLGNKDNPRIEAERRIAMAHLYATSKETYNYLEENKINVFHGTNIKALPNILKYGILSSEKSKEQNIEVTTGEKWSRMFNERGFVSFTDVLDIAEGYSAIDLQDENDMSFEVIIGTSKDKLKNSLLQTVYSDIPEIGIRGMLEKEAIEVIMVPKEKVKIVEKMVDDNIKVLPKERVENKFYYIDEGIAEVYEEKYNEVKSDKKEKEYNIKELDFITKTRKKSKIREIFHKLSSMFNERKEENERGKSR